MPERDDWPEGRPEEINESSLRERARDDRTGGDSAAARIQHQTRWVDLQIKQAMERGEFDNLPGAGKPLGDLGSPYDRDWWLKKLIERENITGVLPPALALRKEDAELDALLDREATEPGVRRILEDFNRRIIEARRQLQGGPPVVTPPREVEGEIARWRERRAAKLRRRSAPAAPEQPKARAAERPRRRWWRR